MLRASWKSLWARKIRLLLSTFAIVLGVAFVAGSLVFTATLDRAFTSIMNGTVGDVMVRPAGQKANEAFAQTRTVPASVVDQVRRVPGVARAEGDVSSYSTFVVGRNGKIVGGQGAPGIAVSYHDAPAGHGTPGLTVREGRAPQRSGEIAMDPATAKRAGYRVGDTVNVVTSGRTPRLSARLVGLASYSAGSLVGASLVVLDPATAQQTYFAGRDVFTDVWVTAEPGHDQAALRKAVAQVLPRGTEAVTGDQAADEASDDIKDALSFISTFLLIFAGVALVVGSFLIVNTFSILVAQRSRELALLRALGASRRQVTRSVLFEAVAVGLVGSTVGLGLGFVLALGIKALFAQFGLDLSGTPLEFTPRAVVAAYVVGMLVTGLAAYLPARRASRVAPVAALRDDVAMPEATVTRRALGGGLMVLAGVGALLWVLTGDRTRETYWLGAGLLGVILGAVLMSPVVGRPVIRGIGLAYRRTFGAVGTLAEQNSLRNPRRTAATASALMIGLALVVMMSVFGASATRSVDVLIAKNFTGDYVVSGTFGTPFSPTVTDQARGVPGVEAVARTRFTQAQIDGDRTGIGAVDPKPLTQVARIDVQQGSLDRLVGKTVFVTDKAAKDKGYRLGDQVRITLGGVTTPMRVVAVVTSTPALLDVTTTIAGYEAAGGPHQDNYAFVARAPGADEAQVRAGLERITAGIPTVAVKDQDEFAAEQRRPIDQMLTLIYALLGLAVVIAVLGIVNTLALSVIERTREIGLLRAVGLSRRQLRRMVRLESVVIAMLGAVLGVVIGIGFGIVLQRSQSGAGVAELAIPWGRIWLFVLLAAAVGVLAAWWPARRAARLDVLRAIATD
ncbi:FtsX-like permease family protein [Luteipulveratus sp. YIM 133132]|uniref:ABC transporter permease n=1 Tax=Luteipulveratus flavus TaxID=3031728 RepID=UPI0023B1B2AA|nr:FtsX-like permease family protein [Luteipulveratus sp. YIM 133132]MDE9367261.1 FtsX-like permease family protein [Luteipulveratus sp. YIM 133132]